MPIRAYKKMHNVNNQIDSFVKLIETWLLDFMEIAGGSVEVKDVQPICCRLSQDALKLPQVEVMMTMK